MHPPVGAVIGRPAPPVAAVLPRPLQPARSGGPARPLHPARGELKIEN